MPRGNHPLPHLDQRAGNLHQQLVTAVTHHKLFWAQAMQPCQLALELTRRRIGVVRQPCGRLAQRRGNCRAGTPDALVAGEFEYLGHSPAPANLDRVQARVIGLQLGQAGGGAGQKIDRTQSSDTG